MIKWPWKERNLSHTEALPWQQALAIPLLASLSFSEQQKLTRLATLFLQQKRLVPLAGFTLDELNSARIALLFCLPILQRGIEYLDGFYDVFISPRPLITDDAWPDHVDSTPPLRSGDTMPDWQHGAVVLNWLDIKDSFDASGFNTVIHEVAYRLDIRSGGKANGVPLSDLREIAGWEYDLHAAINSIQDEIETMGEEACSIDALAATHPAECFAVLSEYFFSSPQLFAPRFASLYRRFCKFYQQDPLQRLLVSRKPSYNGQETAC